jgi:hypothetical protein
VLDLRRVWPCLDWLGAAGFDVVDDRLKRLPNLTQASLITLQLGRYLTAQ